ncbi:DUF4296 domain-containing protein [Flavobacterium terrisoli]|uniref:DUF4296 domain-containing protein n=1 Tax=Flavobacterium terrisoli TaxID=3242195 RepID=UPI00254383BB|nr:DUF4296 domain-containing protein [Flavobacterium buctense]
MKRIVLIGLLLSLISCNDAVEKPKNLIEKDKMIDILYDISLLEAIKTQNIDGGISNKEANEYLFEKYKIDSTQLAESNKYYASDVDEYKKMFGEVKSRLEKQTKKMEGNAAPKNEMPNPDTPQVQ